MSDRASFDFEFATAGGPESPCPKALATIPFRARPDFDSIMTQTHPSEAKPSKRRPWLVLLVLAVIAIAALPWILAKTTLRDRLLNAIVSSNDISVTTTNASLGYISPLSLSGLQIRSMDDATRVEVARIEADRSWLGMLISHPDLGTFRFENPSINVLVDPEKMKANAEQPQAASTTPPSDPIKLPNLVAEIRDAVVVVRTPLATEPPIDLQHIQLTLRLEKQGELSILRIDPSTVFDHQRITPELCGQGLQLIVPLLADEVDAQGEFSLRLEEFQLPIATGNSDHNEAIRIEGDLQLHQASVGLRNTIAKGISDLVLKLVGIGAPDRLTVAKDLVVRFQVVDGRVRHEGLALLLPHGDSSIEFKSSGSVGLDETLDLKVAVKLPDELLGGGALVQRFTKDPIVLAITGTLDVPRVELASSGGLLKSIQSLIKSGQAESEPNATSGEVTEPAQDKLNEQAKEEAMSEAIGGAVDVVGGLLEGLRERSEQREASGEDRSLLPNLRERLRDRPLLRNRREPAPEVEPPSPVPVDL